MFKSIQVGKLAKRAAAAALVLAAVISMSAAQSRPQPPTSLRLYIFDCGTIAPMNVTQYDLKPEEVKGPTGFVTPCYLVVHPRGTLMWEVNVWYLIYKEHPELFDCYYCDHNDSLIDCY